MTANGKTGRRRDHSIDALRACLVLLGIPYHVAFLYAAHSDWAVADLARSDLLEHFSATIHSFRIPAFFLIAGYFTSLVLMRRSETEWMESRLRQIGIPLLSSIAVIMPVTMLLTAFADPSTAPLLPAHLAVARFEEQLATFGSHWIAHLWFLVVLLQFCVLVFYTWKYIRRIDFVALDEIASRNFLSALAIFAVAAFSYQMARTGLNAAALKVAPQEFLNMIYFGPFLGYLPFFLFGLALQMMPRCFERFRRFNWLVLAGTLAMIALFDVSHFESSALEKAANRLAFTFAGIGITSTLMGLFSLWFSAENRFVSRVVDSALVIYIVHFPIVIGFGLLMRNVDQPVLLEFLAVVVLTYVLSYVLARGVARLSTLNFLFTGARRPATS